MHVPFISFNFFSRQARRAGVWLVLAMAAGCGYKGPLYMPPPPPAPAESLTLPPTPGNAPSAANSTTSSSETSAAPLGEIRGK